MARFPLAAAVAVCSVLIAATGLHESPMVAGVGAILVFIGVNVWAVYWALARSASTNGYLKQLGNAALIGLISGAAIFLCSWLMLAVLFPDYQKESANAAIDVWESMGLPKEQIDKQAAALAKQTPFSQSLQGFIGTLVTSIVIGAIVAIFKRRKPQPA